MIRRENVDRVNFHDFLLRNEPVILEGIDSSLWPLGDYFLDPETRHFDPHYFLEVCGNEVIPIHWNGQVIEMEIHDFIKKIMSNESVYAKDWHMFQYSSKILYHIPLPFLDDWLNWFWKCCRNNSDDYRFVYIGGKNTTTGVHHDVLCSYSWSVNLLGQKRWTIWSPKDVPLLFSKDRKFVVSDAREGHYDCQQFPNVHESNRIIVEQNPHEAIFIPAGWYHMVENLEVSSPSITLSLNHNWFNGYSIDKSWAYLLRQYLGVYEEIEAYYPLRQRRGFQSTNNSSFFSSSSDTMLMSLPDWYHHSQYLLQLQAGMNHIEFIALVCMRIYVLKMVSLRRETQERVLATQQVVSNRLIRYLGLYLFRTFKTEGETTTDPSFDSKFEKYLTQCCDDSDPMHEIIYLRLFSHSIELADLLSREHETVTSLPLSSSSQSIVNSYSSLRESILNDELNHVGSVNAWTYCQLQVKSILLDILSSEFIRSEIFHSLCTELNCEVSLFRSVVEEFIESFLIS
jgi:hypothetical protein